MSWQAKFETTNVIKQLNLFDPSGYYEAMYKSAVAFAQRDIAPLNKNMTENNEFPAHLWQAMGAQGLLGITVGQEYGGLGLGYLPHIAIAEAISYASGSVGLSYIAHSNLCMNQIQLNGTEEQKTKFLPKLATGEFVGALAMSEPNAGSDVMSMRLNAVEQEDTYILNGNKLWITNGGKANVIVTYAKTDNTKKGMTAFLVETDQEGFDPPKKINKIGMCGSETYELFYKNCIVPKANILGGIGRGANVLMSGLNYERLLLSAGSLGISQAAFDYTTQYANERTQFDRAIIQNQALAHQLAEYKIKLTVAHKVLYSTAYEADKNHDLTNEDAAAIFHQVAETGKEITNACVELCGGMGYTRDLPLGIYRNDHELYMNGGGSQKMRKEIVARTLGYTSPR